MTIIKTTIETIILFFLNSLVEMGYCLWSSPEPNPRIWCRRIQQSGPRIDAFGVVGTAHGRRESHDHMYSEVAETERRCLSLSRDVTLNWLVRAELMIHGEHEESRIGD